jgi:hypothetical protein
VAAAVVVAEVAAVEVVEAVVEAVVVAGPGGAPGAMVMGVLGVHRPLLVWSLLRAPLHLVNTSPDTEVHLLRDRLLGGLASTWTANLWTPWTLACCS